VSKYASVWFDDSGTGLVNGGTYTFTHNLGTTDLVVSLFVSSSSSGTNPQNVLHDPSGTNDFAGAAVTDISSTTITIQLGNIGRISPISNTGTRGAGSFTWAGEYLKVVAIG
jgi:hypothetical protein